MAAIETGTQDLLVRVEDGVAVLTMNRPERRNALSPAMLEALARALEEAEENDDVACVVLTGAGGAFCAGGDVKAMAEGNGAKIDYDARVAVQRRSQRATSGRLHAMPKPTIAALPGAAAGAGLALALACDLRIAARGAVLTTAFARVGLSGDYGGTWFLTRLVGTAQAPASCTSSPSGSRRRRPSGSGSSTASWTTSGWRRRRSRSQRGSPPARASRSPT